MKNPTARRLTLSLTVTLAAFSWTAPARADVITTFQASGSVTDGSTISGTLTIDTTTGIITAADVIFGAPASTIQTNVVAQVPHYYVPNSVSVNIRNAASTTDFDFSIPTPTSSLIGYLGSTDSAAFLAANPGNLYNLTTSTGYDELTSFALTPTPEPASFALFAGGGLVLLFVFRLRTLTESSR